MNKSQSFVPNSCKRGGHQWAHMMMLVNGAPQYCKDVEGAQLYIWMCTICYKVRGRAQQDTLPLRFRAKPH